jgi:hypothetical protein
MVNALVICWTEMLEKLNITVWRLRECITVRVVSQLLEILLGPNILFSPVFSKPSNYFVHSL